MLKRLLIWVVSLVSVLWIIVSYLPAVKAVLPTFALPNSSWPALLAAAGFVLFIAIQLWLVKTTYTAVRAYLAQPSPAPFRLHLDREVFWTALPILMTVGLAWASLDLWRNLVAP